MNVESRKTWGFERMTVVEEEMPETVVLDEEANPTRRLRALYSISWTPYHLLSPFMHNLVYCARVMVKQGEIYYYPYIDNR